MADDNDLERLDDEACRVVIQTKLACVIGGDVDSSIAKLRRQPITGFAELTVDDAAAVFSLLLGELRNILQERWIAHVSFSFKAERKSS